MTYVFSNVRKQSFTPFLRWIYIKPLGSIESESRFTLYHRSAGTSWQPALRLKPNLWKVSSCCPFSSLHPLTCVRRRVGRCRPVLMMFCLGCTALPAAAVSPVNSDVVIYLLVSRFKSGCGQSWGRKETQMARSIRWEISSMGICSTPPDIRACVCERGRVQLFSWLTALFGKLGGNVMHQFHFVSERKGLCSQKPGKLILMYFLITVAGGVTRSPGMRSSDDILCVLYISV